MPITYDEKTKTYRRENGQIITDKQIRREMDRARLAFRKEAQRLSGQLERGVITAIAFGLAMESLVKDHQIIASSVGAGGFRQMGQTVIRNTSAKIKKEFGYLKGFVKKIAAGVLSFGLIRARAASYAAAILPAFYEAETETRKDSEQLVKRVLHASESCADCADLAGQWMTVADMPPIGSVQCQSRCLCELVYKDGE